MAQDFFEKEEIDLEFDSRKLKYGHSLSQNSDSSSNGFGQNCIKHGFQCLRNINFVFVSNWNTQGTYQNYTDFSLWFYVALFYLILQSSVKNDFYFS